MSIILGFEIQMRGKLLGKEGRKAVRDSVKAGMIEAAWQWHAVILDKHFVSSNRGRYQHEKRTDVYLNFIKKMQGTGVGRFVDQIKTGKSRRFLKAFASVSGTARSVTLTMKPGRYFTNPFVGSFTDPRTGEQKRVTRQPDKVAELTRVHVQDARDLRDFAARKVANLLRAEEYIRNIRIAANV